jgi:hypothetical protein
MIGEAGHSDCARVQMDMVLIPSRLKRSWVWHSIGISGVFSPYAKQALGGSRRETLPARSARTFPFACDSDPRAGLDACERDTCEVERRLIERSAVEGSVDTECLAQPPRSRAETTWIGCSPPFSHEVDAIDRLKCPNQNGAADLGATDKIATPMDAVAAIDIAYVHAFLALAPDTWTPCMPIRRRSARIHLLIDLRFERRARLATTIPRSLHPGVARVSGPFTAARP